jgi:hypothetical protein
VASYHEPIGENNTHSVNLGLNFGWQPCEAEKIQNSLFSVLPDRHRTVCAKQLVDLSLAHSVWNQSSGGLLSQGGLTPREECKDNNPSKQLL